MVNMESDSEYEDILWVADRVINAILKNQQGTRKKLICSHCARKSNNTVPIRLWCQLQHYILASSESHHYAGRDQSYVNNDRQDICAGAGVV